MPAAKKAPTRVGAVNKRPEAPSAPAESTLAEEMAVLTDQTTEMTPQTLLDDLREELRRDAAADKEPIRLVVPNRPDMKVIYDTTAIEMEQIRMWAKAARKGHKKAEDANIMVMAYGMLVASCIGIVWKGAEYDWTFTSPNMLAITGKASPRDVVKWVYGQDGHILQTMKRIGEEAGFSDELDLDDDGPLGD